MNKHLHAVILRCAQFHFMSAIFLAASMAFVVAFLSVKMEEAFHEGFESAVESMNNNQNIYDGKKRENEFKKIEVIK